MSFQVNFGEKKTQRFSATDIDGIQLNAITNDGENPSGGEISGNVDWSSIYITATLSQKGKETTLFSSNVKELALAATYHNSQFSHCFGQSEELYTGTEPYPENCSLFLPFGQTLNLREEDVVTVEVSAPVQAIRINRIGYISVSTNEAIGVQYCNPKVIAQAIPVGESNYSMTLGDNVTNVFLINTSDGQNRNWLKQVRIFSDRYNVNNSLDEVVNDVETQFEGRESRVTRVREACYHVLSQEVDKARIQLDLTPESISAGECYIVYTTYTTDRSQFSKGLASEKKHEKYDLKKIKA
jgi:hypothetical protein